MTKLVTNYFKNHNIDQILESFNESSNSSYYLIVSNHVDDLTTEIVHDTPFEVYHNVFQNLIQGKRIANTDVVALARNIPYSSNTVYAMYDHEDEDLPNKDFYVVVDEGTYNHVYKCLDNNRDSPSTVQPDFSHISGANTELYQTSDGYRWKYMYTFDDTQKLKFETNEYIPIIANSTVSNSACGGTIEIIKVQTTGRKFDNYLLGTFSSFDLSIGGNTRIYQISNNEAKNSNGFYTDCYIYISGGIGLGQYKKITDYYSNTVGKYIILNSEFETKPTNSSEYQIYPSVKITGSESVTEQAEARALINASSSNSVYRIEMLNRGAGYTYFANAEVIANSSVGVQANALLKVILSPPCGHGKNPFNELYSNAIEFSVKLSNNESNTITTTNYFSQLGIIKNPIFNEVSIEYKDLVDVFIDDELVYKIQPFSINVATTNTNSNVVTINLDIFSNQLKSGDLLYINYPTDDLHQLITISSVTNSTSIQLSKNAYTTANNVLVYKANETSFGYKKSSNSSHLTLYDFSGTISSNDLFVGITSGAKTYANSILINGTNKNFNTFIGMPHHVGSISSGSFNLNEYIYQEDINSSNAILHSIVSGSEGLRLFYTNHKGLGSTANVIGANSGATFTVDSSRKSDIKFGSGEILFVENISPVTRTANTSETFQIIFEY